MREIDVKIIEDKIAELCIEANHYLGDDLKSCISPVSYTHLEDIQTDDEELKSFLFSLGCYSGEPITVIAHLKGGCTVSIKDGRYNICLLYTSRCV